MKRADNKSPKKTLGRRSREIRWNCSSISLEVWFSVLHAKMAGNSVSGR